MSNVEIDTTWDPVKAQSNVAKHGVTFVQAATVLLDALALSRFDAVHSEFEERWFTLGKRRFIRRICQPRQRVKRYRQAVNNAQPI
jgi:uncharacterized DUF497 family protein